MGWRCAMHSCVVRVLGAWQPCRAECVETMLMHVDVPLSLDATVKVEGR